MNENELLPPNQNIKAVNALLGDSPSQREVLEMAVHLAEAGIEPIEIFKQAALTALKTALENGKLPAPRDAKKKGSDGEEFKLAVMWWKAELTGHPKPGSAVAYAIDPGGKKNLLPAISRATKRHSLLAKERALFALAWNSESGPNTKWILEWDKYRDELQGWWRQHVDALPPEVVDLLRKQSGL